MKRIARFPIRLCLLLSAQCAVAQTADKTRDSQLLHAKLCDVAAFIERCDSTWLWRFRTEDPEDSGRSLSEQIIIGLEETGRCKGAHGDATVMVALLHIGVGLDTWAFPAALVADGPDTSVYYGCEPLGAIACDTERFADITGDGLPELVLNCHFGQRVRGLRVLSVTGLDASLRVLGRMDSANSQMYPVFSGDAGASIVETDDSELPVIVVHENHQRIRAGPLDSTIRHTATYFRFHDGKYEVAREVSWLPGGRDTVEVVFERKSDRN